MKTTLARVYDRQIRDARLKSTLPYLAIAIPSWLLAMVALSIRVASALWTPVVELFWWQALLFVLIRLPTAERRRCSLASPASVVVQLSLLGLGMWLAPEE